MEIMRMPTLGTHWWSPPESPNLRPLCVSRPLPEPAIYSEDNQHCHRDTGLAARHVSSNNGTP